MLIGSCDLMNGKAVQLENGDPNRTRITEDNVESLVDNFSLTGPVAIIDLDAALGRGDNRELIASLCRRARVFVGGGIRDEKTAREILRMGAEAVIIGTAANPELLSKLPKESVIAALDMKQGEVVDQGWTRSTGESFLDRAERLEPFCRSFLVTQVEHEGLMLGFDFQPLRELKERVKTPLIAAGGIRNYEEVRGLASMNIQSQLGMALYRGHIDLHRGFCEVGDWSKGLLPAVVQERGGEVRMVGFMNREALEKTLETRKATFWSRSRNQLWTKGESSGNTLYVRYVAWDCDRDSLLLQCEPQGVTCHLGTRSCFDTTAGSPWPQLSYDIAKHAASGGWTSKLLSKPDLLGAKILEEAQEVVSFKDRDNLVWELADLFYHSAVLMEREGVSIEEIGRELNARRK